jgi:site-specific recombinase XerD
MKEMPDTKPPRIRKSFIGHGLGIGAGIGAAVGTAVIQSLLGHSDIRTTLVCDKITVEKMRNDLLKLDRPR